MSSSDIIAPNLNRSIQREGKTFGSFVGIVTTDYVLFPKSTNWFIYGNYDFELGKVISNVGFPTKNKLYFSGDGSHEAFYTPDIVRKILQKSIARFMKIGS